MKITFMAVLAWAVLTVGVVSAQVEAAEDADAPRADSGTATFKTLTFGGRTLRNVTVSERTSSMVYLKHEGGLLGIRVTELDPEARQALGYEAESDMTRSARAGLREGLGNQADEWAAAMNRWPERTPFAGELGTGLGLFIFGIAGLIGLGVHLLVSFLLRMICRKADAEPGFLIWVPILQIFPLLKAARMSQRWPLAIVGLSLMGILLAGFSIELALLVSVSSSLLAMGLWIAWSIKICLARGKHPVWAVCLLLPGLNFVGLVYLAAAE
jgi:hypothetical protein